MIYQIIQIIKENLISTQSIGNKEFIQIDLKIINKETKSIIEEI